jgi:prepilin-type N-terminal cleavage/methylation domain-containing protein
MRSPRRDAGFTLLELLLVVAILVIVGGIAIPSVTEGVRRHRLQASASMVAGKLTEARINALKRNRPTWLLIDTAARRVQVQTSDAGGAAVNIGEPGTLSEGIDFGATPTQVDYDAMGRLTAVQAIAVTSNGSARTVTVGLTGATTIN